MAHPVPPGEGAGNARTKGSKDHDYQDDELVNVDYEDVAHGRAKGASRHREKAKRSNGKKELGSARHQRAEEVGHKLESQEPAGSTRKATERSKPDERLHAPVAGDEKHMRLDRK